MCSIDVNKLADFNVHNIKPSLNFELDAPNLVVACQQQGPLVMCLVPPEPRLQTMCEQITIKPYFDAVLDGNTATTLDELPIVWDATYNPDDTREWIPLSENPNVLYPDGTYVGLQSLPNFIDVAVSNDCKLLFGVANGQLYRTNPNIGLVETVIGVNGTSDAFQSVALNGTGTLGAVLFSNKLFLYQNGGFVEVPNLTTLSYVSIKIIQTITFTRLIVVFRNANFCFVTNYIAEIPAIVFSESTTKSLGINSNSIMLWTVVTDFFEHTLVAIDNLALTTYDVAIFINGTAGPGTIQWNVARSFSAGFLTGAWSGVCNGSFISSTLINVLVANRNSKFIFNVVLPVASSSGTETLDTRRTLRITEAMNQNFAAFQETITGTIYAGRNINLVSQISTGLPVEANSVLFFNPNSTKTWCFLPVSRQIFSNTNSPPSIFGIIWVLQAVMYLNAGLHVSDFGIRGLITQPQITWFFGHTITTILEPFVPGATFVSPHQYFRFVLDVIVPATTTSFATVLSHIERANLFAILANNGSLRLYNNAQTVVVAPSSETIVWSRNTNDQWSDDEGFVEQKTFNNFPISSSNGLYLLYKPNNTSNTIRVSFNVFNSAAFADYVADGNKERLARAVQRQLNFCTTQLQSSDPDVSIDGLFADKRCSCLAKNIMFKKLFPVAADGDSFGASKARLIDNLSCLLSTCQGAIGNEEVTVVYRTVTEQCQGAQLSLCSAVLTKGENTQIKLVSGIVSQSCGSSLVGCTDDASCALGSSCVNGLCVANCLVNSDCIAGFDCLNGVCIKPLPSPPPPQNPNSQQSQTLMIVLIVMVVIILIALLLVLFVGKKNK